MKDGWDFFKQTRRRRAFQEEEIARAEVSKARREFWGLSIRCSSSGLYCSVGRSQTEWAKMDQPDPEGPMRFAQEFGYRTVTQESL